MHEQERNMHVYTLALKLQQACIRQSTHGIAVCMNLRICLPKAVNRCTQTTLNIQSMNQEALQVSASLACVLRIP